MQAPLRALLIRSSGLNLKIRGPNAACHCECGSGFGAAHRDPRSEPRAHQHRPPGYLYLKAALEHYAETGKTPARWDGVDAATLPQTSPFHEWLIAQVDPAGGAGSFGSLERLAYDYRAGVAEGDHRVAATGADLLAILDELGVDGEVRVVAGRTVAAWMRSNTDEQTLHPERTDHLASDHEGWGAGSGTTSRTEYDCPCGQGRIVEERDDIPGFRDHSVFLDCDECRAHWRLVDGSEVLEPGPTAPLELKRRPSRSSRI